MCGKLQPNFDIKALHVANKPLPQVIKVGVLPFLAGADGIATEVLLMKPRPKPKHLIPPAFQIAKGTRHIIIGGETRDMTEADLAADASGYEPLADTALREGHEEVGLRPDNIRAMFDMGVYEFASETTGKIKRVHMFAAEIKDKLRFNAFEDSTLAVEWIEVSALTRRAKAKGDDAVRADHAKIVQKIVAGLGD